MPKRILNDAEIQEACLAMGGLRGARCKAEARRLAEYFDCHESRLYAVTKQVRSQRKARTDKGKRRVDLKEHAGMSLATSLVVGYNLDPDLALETARANGHATPISLGTYHRMLREAGLNRSQRHSKRVVYRRNEAKLPGEIFQFDISGLKTRWVDIRTRRILHVSESEVSPNHPNKKSTRIPLWKFTMKDDHSRKVFTQFVAVEKPTQTHAIDFEIQAFAVMGVPLILYTDNDPVIVGRLNKRAAKILNQVFADSGGFELKQHAPKNPNAGGKVEASHLYVEKFEKEIGIGEVPTLEELNKFAIAFCDRINWTKHRDTGIKPEVRFRDGHGVFRVPPIEVLASLKAEEFDAKVNGDVTFSHDGTLWQLPRSPLIASSLKGEKYISNPFPDLAVLGKKVSIVWPKDAEWFLATAVDQLVELPKTVAVADAAFEYKSVAESTAERNMKHFKGVADDMKKAVRAGEAKIVRPGIDVEFEIVTESRPLMLPRKTINPSLEEWAELAPGTVPPSMVDGQRLDYYAAASLLQREEVLETPLTPVDQQWLKSVFGMRDQVTENELREALVHRNAEPPIAEVRSA